MKKDKSKDKPFQYPKYIRRIDDGEIFIRNKNNTYSLRFMIRRFPESFTFEHTYEQLMVNHKGSFEHY